MKALVAYYSLEGNTKYVAEEIAAALDAELLCIEPEKAYPTGAATKFMWCGKSAVMCDSPKLKPCNIDVSAYDMIVLGTPVWASTFAPPLRTFLTENKLSGKKLAFFANSDGGPTQKCFVKLGELTPGNTLVDTLSLVSPVKWKKPDTKEKIAAFCARLKEQSN